jgi:pimeloyl-ACP methyl ester carboxylesterase
VPVHPPLPHPAILLCGTRDPLFPMEWLDKLHLDFEQFEVRVLEDAGHFTPLQAPEAVADAIRALSSTA